MHRAWTGGRRLFKPTRTMVQLPSPILVCCGVLFGLLFVDSHFDIPFLLSDRVAAGDVADAFWYYTKIERISSDSLLFALPIPAVGCVALLTLVSQLLQFFLIEDFFSILPVGIMIFQFIDGVLLPRKELLSLNDQPLLQEPLLSQIATAHFYIFLCVLAIVVLQVGAQRSIAIRRQSSEGLLSRQQGKPKSQ